MLLELSTSCANALYIWADTECMGQATVHNPCCVDILCVPYKLAKCPGTKAKRNELRMLPNCSLSNGCWSQQIACLDVQGRQEVAGVKAAAAAAAAACLRLLQRMQRGKAVNLYQRITVQNTQYAMRDTQYVVFESMIC